MTSGLTLRASSLGYNLGDRVGEASLYEVNGLPAGEMVFIRKVGGLWRIHAVWGPPLEGLAFAEFASPTEALVVLHATLL